MARYAVTVKSPRPPGEAFAYMADLNNFAEWDPGVERVVQVRGDAGGENAAFDVTVKAAGLPLELRYITTEYQPPERLVVVAESAWLTSVDEITVAADGSGSVVTYDARLTLKGPLGLIDPLLAMSFAKIGDRAARGLIDALDGERVDAAAT